MGLDNKKGWGGKLRLLAALIPTFGVAEAPSAAGQTSPDRPTLAALPPDGVEQKRVPKRIYKYNLEKNGGIVDLEDPATFWRELKRARFYKVDDFADDILLHATRKSPGGYWSSLSDFRIRERLLNRNFITAALEGVDGVEIFLKSVDTGGIGQLIPEREEQESLIVLASSTDPVHAARFIRDYYERHEQREHFWGADSILEGIRAWRERTFDVGSGEGHTAAEDSKKAGYEQMVHVLNYTYVLPMEKRLRIAEGLGPATVYRIATVAPKEIFTSTYKKILVPLIKTHAQETGLWTYLQSVDNNHTYKRDFFSLGARFGELPTFLKHANNSDAREIGRYLIGALESGSDGVAVQDVVS
ncbi:MAG: hypothetical protein HY460_02230, partial [Parcubacteria group bacterium]|nr:hypothetical protein [Parcubacteria group bacterium]